MIFGFLIFFIIVCVLLRKKCNEKIQEDQDKEDYEQLRFWFGFAIIVASIISVGLLLASMFYVQNPRESSIVESPFRNFYVDSGEGLRIKLPWNKRVAYSKRGIIQFQGDSEIRFIDRDLNSGTANLTVEYSFSDEYLKEVHRLYGTPERFEEVFSASLSSLAEEMLGCYGTEVIGKEKAIIRTSILNAYIADWKGVVFEGVYLQWVEYKNPINS